MKFAQKREQLHENFIKKLHALIAAYQQKANIQTEDDRVKDFLMKQNQRLYLENQELKNTISKKTKTLKNK